MGYCLINSTKAQAMLFVVGNGGEGKSRIGVVLYDIFKDSAYFGSIADLAADKFLKSNLIGKSVLIDDDMNLHGLKDTSFLKSLATSETPLTVQAKGIQGVQVMLSVRSICFSNGSPSALHDKSDGWSRRLLILSVKPIPPDRMIDRCLSDKLLAEKEGIFLWMFEGVQRLIRNGFEFTRSEKSERNLVEMKEDNCNIIAFLKDNQFVEFDKNSECSTAALYKNYCAWCSANGQIELKKDTFSGWLKQNQTKYGLTYSDYIIDEQNRRARGYRGIKILKAI
jgi:putative DNA primase/helicase